MLTLEILTAEIFPMKVRSKAVSLATYVDIIIFLSVTFSHLSSASNWIFNFALAWAVPPGLSTIAWKVIFGSIK